MRSGSKNLRCRVHTRSELLVVCEQKLYQALIPMILMVQKKSIANNIVNYDL